MVLTLSRKAPDWTKLELEGKSVEELKRIHASLVRPVQPEKRFRESLEWRAPWIRAILATQEAQRKAREKGSGIQLSMFDTLPPADIGLQEKSPVLAPNSATAASSGGEMPVVKGFIGEPPVPAAPVSVPPEEENGDAGGESEVKRKSAWELLIGEEDAGAAPTALATESAPAPLAAPTAPAPESAPAPPGDSEGADAFGERSANSEADAGAPQVPVLKLEEGARVIVTQPGEWEGYAGTLLSPDEPFSSHQRKRWQLRSVTNSDPAPKRWWVVLDDRGIKLVLRETELLREREWQQLTGLKRLGPGCQVVVSDPAEEEWFDRTGILMKPKSRSFSNPAQELWWVFFDNPPCVSLFRLEQLSAATESAQVAVPAQENSVVEVWVPPGAGALADAEELLPPGAGAPADANADANASASASAKLHPGVVPGTEVRFCDNAAPLGTFLGLTAEGYAEVLEPETDWGYAITPARRRQLYPESLFPWKGSEQESNLKVLTEFWTKRGWGKIQQEEWIRSICGWFEPLRDIGLCRARRLVKVAEAELAEIAEAESIGEKVSATESAWVDSVADVACGAVATESPPPATPAHLDSVADVVAGGGVATESPPPATPAHLDSVAESSGDVEREPATESALTESAQLPPLAPAREDSVAESAGALSLPSALNPGDAGSTKPDPEALAENLIRSFGGSVSSRFREALREFCAEAWGARKANFSPDLRFFVNAQAGTYQSERNNLCGDIQLSPVRVSRGKVRIGIPEGARSLNFREAALLLDSGAFSEVRAQRVSPQRALERQLSVLSGFPCQPQDVWLVSYDRLIDEKLLPGGGRVKERWGAEEAEQAVKETVSAARFLAGQREMLPFHSLVLTCQGVDAPQYLRCADQILEFCQPQDILGLGGWCILGRQKKWLSVFYPTMRSLLPLVAEAGVARVHLFGVSWYKLAGGIAPPLPWLLRLCDNYGIELSSDSSAPILNALRKSDWKKAGASFPNWRENLAWTKASLGTLRDSEFYRDDSSPTVIDLGKLLSMSAPPPAQKDSVVKLGSIGVAVTESGPPSIPALEDSVAGSAAGDADAADAGCVSSAGADSVAATLITLHVVAETGSQSPDAEIGTAPDSKALPIRQDSVVDAAVRVCGELITAPISPPRGAGTDPRCLPPATELTLSATAPPADKDSRWGCWVELYCPAGRAKGDNKYFRFVWIQQRRHSPCRQVMHVPGGNSFSPVAERRARDIKYLIAIGTPPEEIAETIKSWRSRRQQAGATPPFS